MWTLSHTFYNEIFIAVDSCLDKKKCVQFSNHVEYFVLLFINSGRKFNVRTLTVKGTFYKQKY